MRITISRTGKPASVTILHLEGKLDRANFESLIDAAQEVYDLGARDLILDMSKLTFIASAGVSALHQVGLLFRTVKGPTTDGGWGTFHSWNDEDPLAPREHVKLLSPPRHVLEVLNMSGFGSLFEIYTDLHRAVSSFHQAAPERLEQS